MKFHRGETSALWLGVAVIYLSLRVGLGVVEYVRCARSGGTCKPQIDDVGQAAEVVAVFLVGLRSPRREEDEAMRQWRESQRSGRNPEDF